MAKEKVVGSGVGMNKRAAMGVLASCLGEIMSLMKNGIFTREVNKLVDRFNLQDLFFFLVYHMNA